MIVVVVQIVKITDTFIKSIKRLSIVLLSRVNIKRYMFGVDRLNLMDTNHH